MNISLRVLDASPGYGNAQPGDCWREADSDAEGRECWVVSLPDTSGDVGTPGHPSWLQWRTTQRASKPPHELWDVTGTPPAMTVQPSIDILRHVQNPDYNFDKKPEEQPGVPSHIQEGSYFHGFITNGVIHL